MSKNEALEATMKEMRDEINQKEKRIVQLETELNHTRAARMQQQAAVRQAPKKQ